MAKVYPYLYKNEMNIYSLTANQVLVFNTWTGIIFDDIIQENCAGLTIDPLTGIVTANEDCLIHVSFQASFTNSVTTPGSDAEFMKVQLQSPAGAVSQKDALISTSMEYINSINGLSASGFLELSALDTFQIYAFSGATARSLIGGSAVDPNCYLRIMQLN